MAEEKYWGMTAPQIPSAMIAAQAKQMEDWGVEGVFAPQLYGPPFLPLVAASTMTTRLKLATGIALAFARSPFETAMAAMDMDRMSGGRFVLGLGPSVKAWSEGFFGQPYGKPVAHLREVIEAVRLIVAKAHTGELDKYEGEYVNLDFDFFQPTTPPVRTEIPIWVAALRGPLVRLGAEIADGVIGHPLWSVRWATTEIPKYIDEGLASAGRARSDIDVNLWVWTSPGVDKKTATEEARATMAFYGGAEQYHSYFEWHGFGDVVVKLQDGLRDGTGYQDLAHLVPDEMVQEFILCGTPDEVREQLDPLWEIATSVTPVPAAWGLPMDRLITYMDSIGRTFYPGLREG